MDPGVRTSTAVDSGDVFDSLLTQLKALDSVENLRHAVGPEKRQELMLQCQKVFASLEAPFELTQRVTYSPFLLIATRTAQGYGILSRLARARSSGVPCRISELATHTQIEEGVLISLLDYLCSQFICEEVAPEEYVGTATADMLNAPAMEVPFQNFQDIILPGGWIGFYRSLAPDESRSGWQIGRNTQSTFYEWLDDPSHAVDSQKFHRFMEVQFKGIPSWLDDIDFISMYAKGAKANDVVFVDVGGGNGQESGKLRVKVPNLVGKVVVQDLPGPLNRAPEISGVEKMEYDYTGEQTIKGARIYYFRQIFHNNSDKDCIAILNNHRPAMASESVILIDEKVVPDDDKSSQMYTSALSLSMWALFRGLERKRRQWLKLLDQAGFEARDIRKYTDFGDCIITAVPKE
ncbi:S-adenosyl-L-methionine-dependent methyltransferase [Rhizodiscina lignyota]|uniref:S-adenosyl-L-methionine-dependent methyltransferase n=1 Tax=Rhizodiscina lignyota TaxID=1504668 RepID=A0A9P4M5K2_9PEZI|nr:S-adenosyl-L-methionine-dependent methyltransferase [Rhizodiscina lignyota]